MPRTAQQKSQNKREQRPDGSYYRTFDVAAADRLRQTYGTQQLHGADAAVLSALNAPITAEDALRYQEESMTETTRAEDTDTGFMGFFGRLFSRRVSFSVNGAQIDGKNGHQVRGNTVPLMSGAALDLAPATLTGQYTSATEQSATGSGAYLYMAPLGARSVVQQKMNNIVLKSDQTVQADSAQAAVLPLAGLRLHLNETKLVQEAANKPAIYLPSVTVESVDGTIESVRSADAKLENGVTTIAQMSFLVKGDGVEDTAVCLQGVALTEDGLCFHAGAFRYTYDGQSGMFALPSNVLSIRSLQEDVQNAKTKLYDQSIAEKKAEDAPSQGPAVDEATAEGPVADIPVAAPELVPQEEDASQWLLPESIENGQITLTQTDKHFEQKGEYTVSVALDTNIVTTGRHAIDMKGATFQQDGVKLAVRNGKVFGKIGDGELEGKAKYDSGTKKEGWSFALRDAEIVDSKLVAGQLFVEQSLGDGIALGADDNQALNAAQESLTDSVSFGFGLPPRRSLFNGVQLDDAKHLNATFASNAMPKYTISKDPFEIELDFDKNEFNAKYKNDKSFIPDRHESYPLAAVPLIPGLLAFTMSLEPILGMEGSFDVGVTFSDDLLKPGSTGELSLSGGGAFHFEVGAAISAAIEAGATGLLTVYAALNAALKASVDPALNAAVALKKTEKGAFHFDKLDLSGEVLAALEGSIGGSVGVRFLIYKADLVQYTFKTWKLAQMGLSAAVSKDASKGITKGWSLENSSFTLQAFGKKFTDNNSASNNYGIQGSSETVGKSVALQEGFGKLKEEIDQITSNFATLKKALDEASADENNPSAVIIDMNFLNQQAELLLAFYAKLSAQSEEMRQAQEELAVRLPEMEKRLNKEYASKKDDIKKHEDRLAYFDMVQRVLKEDKAGKMSYQAAKKKASAQWKEKEVQRVATEMNAFDTIEAHEKTQRNDYLTKVEQAMLPSSKRSAQASAAKHIGRLEKLDALKEQYKENPTMLNVMVLELYESEELANLKERVYKNIKEMTQDDTNSKGYQKANETAGAKKRSENAHERALEYTASHIAYEKTRADVYSVEPLRAQVNELRKAMQDNAALIPQYKAMETVFATGAVLQGGSVGVDASNAQLGSMLAYLRGAENINKIQAQLENTRMSAATQKKCQAYLSAVTNELDAPALNGASQAASTSVSEGNEI